MTSTKRIVNFGGNVTFTPQVHEEPAGEDELLEVLRRHAGLKLRVYSSLHAWSPVAACDEVAINLHRFDGIEIRDDGRSPRVVVGGGCTIKRLLEELNRQGWTLPSIALVKEQTIAGATSTGTHGSGGHSLSHYIQSARIATCDASGKPVIHEIEDGPELLAARCGLGSLGVVVSVELPLRRQYQVEEHFRWYDSLEDVLAAEEEFPLQQFFLVPWRWEFLCQHRREIEAPRSRLAGLYRLYWLLCIDYGLHLAVLILERLLPDWFTPQFFRRVVPLTVPPLLRIVDRSDRQLTMEHQLFRHIETEMFVTRSRLPEMIAFSHWLLALAAGETPPGEERWRAAIQSVCLTDDCESLKGCYRHHYPICIRKILTDETLISMASGGDEPWYAVSFISYAAVDHRDGFFQFADVLVRATGALFEARPHWGKHGPLPNPDAERLYPRLQEFCDIRQQLDPTEAFRPEWL